VVSFFVFKSKAYVFLMCLFLPIACLPIMAMGAESLYFVSYYLGYGVELIAPICFALTASTSKIAVFFGLSWLRGAF